MSTPRTPNGTSSEPQLATAAATESTPPVPPPPAARRARWRWEPAAALALIFTLVCAIVGVALAFSKKADQSVVDNKADLTTVEKHDERLNTVEKQEAADGAKLEDIHVDLGRLSDKMDRLNDKLDRISTIRPAP